MNPAARLRERLPEIVQRLECFARVPRELVPDVVAALRATVDADTARAEAARQAREARSAAIRAAIERAAGALPMTRPQRELVTIIRQRFERNPGRYGIEHTPCTRTIRAALRKINGTSETQVPHGRAVRGYAAASTST